MADGPASTQATLVKKLVLKQQGSRKQPAAIAISGHKVLQTLAARRSISEEEVVEGQITTGVDRYLKQSGQGGAEWSLVTISNAMVELDQVASAIVLHLQDGSVAWLADLAEVEGEEMRMLLNVLSTTGKLCLRYQM